MMKSMKILNIVGTRPNYIKIAPLIEQMDQSAKINYSLIHTGQHYDENMNQIFFDQLGIPSPNFNLGVKSGSSVQQVSQILEKFGKSCEKVHRNMAEFNKLSRKKSRSVFPPYNMDCAKFCQFLPEFLC